MLFVSSVKPIKVKTELGEYQAGKLSVIGLEGTAAYNLEVQEYCRAFWGYDAKKNTWARDSRKDKRERESVWTFLLNKGVPVLQSDAESLFAVEDIAKLAEKQPEQFEECLKAAIRQNPGLAPVGYEISPEDDKHKSSNPEEAAGKN